MRLRRENGDFDFILNVNDGTCTIPKNLFPEQLIGQIVIINNIYGVITSVSGAKGDATYTLAGSGTMTFTYTVATGAVTVNS